MALLSLSLQAVHDTSGNRVLDGRLSVFQAGTTTPAPAYADAGFGNRLPHPLLARGSGTWPPIYLPPGEYDLRITDPYNYVYDEVAGVVIDAPSSGGGGSGGDVDDKRLAQTGDIKDRYGVGTHPGWVRANGRTIGSAASSASERANDDCEALFSFLWTQDPNLAVSAGRGANAAADWAAGKTIALPDMRGRTRVALDDLGNTAAGRLAGALFAFGGATALGSYGGEASHVQTTAEMATHIHPVSATMDVQGNHAHGGGTSTDGDHFHGFTYNVQVGYTTPGGAGAVNNVGGAGNATGFTGATGGHFHNIQTNISGAHAHNIFASMTAQGSSAAMSWMQPFTLISTYIKL
ncbi:hypothetical protein LNAOJCKE_0957 [Methylorubrum aminovorans]|uniref:Tail fiber protein n=1 Tax=Methylorubrum aminovorans TaxID=269069 RepID=A0ABQ4U925_9HYPH|nr:hypothetical protein [Methylorubrum aminovorans]GJE63759.1 hypothetical protein LNAOJCKE_0957 [Methylorubrum aminovorans]GMA73598.1 hypothetical protein GCM10025880_00150 [Methylorubrum aminovorans]GMA73686.1 hypothetical protein GCM10025880_01030 [Methylorubrum aminovorans]